MTGVSVGQHLRGRVLQQRLELLDQTDTSPSQFGLTSYPGAAGGQAVGESPVCSIWCENLCQLCDGHAIIMQTDVAAEVNLTIMRVVAGSLPRAARS